MYYARGCRINKPQKAGQPERVARLSVFSAFLNYNKLLFTALGSAVFFCTCQFYITKNLS